MTQDAKISGKNSPNSSLRMRYLAEVEVLRRQHGSLEEIRERLGMSRRKLCQTLMVDPSAWTRWTRDSSGVCPPHIYQALIWYLRLKTQENPASLQLSTPLEKEDENPPNFPSFWKIILSLNSLFLLGILGYLAFSR